MRRLLVSPAHWNSPTDCVIRGSIPGGSHCEARVSVPPRFGGLVLAGIQSGYGEVAAHPRPGRTPAARAATPPPPQVVRSRNSRRVTRTAIGLSFSVTSQRAKDERAN